jgi:hypothetical protein
MVIRVDFVEQARLLLGSKSEHVGKLVQNRAQQIDYFQLALLGLILQKLGKLPVYQGADNEAWLSGSSVNGFRHVCRGTELIETVQLYVRIAKLGKNRAHDPLSGFSGRVGEEVEIVNNRLLCMLMQLN